MAKRRFSAAQRRAQRSFAARFGGRKAKAKRPTRRRKTTYMAKRSSRRFYASRKSSAPKAGIAGALGRQLGGQVAGPLGRAGGTIAAGKWAKSETVETLGWFDLGQQLVSGVNLGGMFSGLTGSGTGGTGASATGTSGGLL